MNICIHVYNIEDNGGNSVWYVTSFSYAVACPESLLIFAKHCGKTSSMEHLCHHDPH